MDLSSEIYHALLPAFITIVLGLPATALGAIDGIAEATANFAKLLSGRFSDRSLRRKPWIVAGYGLAALSKPLFPLAASAPAVMAARFADRIGKGIRGSPRDAMVADETPPEIRGRAFGLQAVARHGRRVARADRGDRPDVLVRERHPRGLLDRDHRRRRRRSCSPGWRCASPRSIERRSSASPFFAGFRHLDKATRRLLAVGFLFSARALLGRLPDPQGHRRRLERSLVAADAGAVQPRLCRARLSRRRAQRPDEPARRS